MAYTLELNTKGLDARVVNKFKLMAKNYSYEVVEHGPNRIAFTSDRGISFTNLVDGISRLCEVYGVDYFSLLDLD